MTKNQIRKELAKLKIEFGDGLVPLIPAIETAAMNVAMIEAVVTLANKDYLAYEWEAIEDDEGVRHGFKRGYRMTQKAKDLLEGV